MTSGLQMRSLLDENSYRPYHRIMTHVATHAIVRRRRIIAAGAVMRMRDVCV